jgi:hypothetical protein
MKKQSSIGILLSIFCITTLARIVVPWTDDKMRAASDLIVVGTVSQVRDLDETNTALLPGIQLRGVETSFKVFEIFKGAPTKYSVLLQKYGSAGYADLSPADTNFTVVLHHYRFDGVIPPNSPSLVVLSPADTNQYLLYLVKDGSTRYAPVSGQLDPAADAVRTANSDRILSATGIRIIH